MIRNVMQRFMYGRYGNDQLNFFLFGVFLVLYVLHVFTRFGLLYYASVLILFLALFRMLSRNQEKRRSENARFQHAAAPVLSWLRLRRNIHRDKEHCYFKCPHCGQYLRVPRGMGKITVTCRNCGTAFEKKS